MNPYGTCPQCGAEVVMRERCPNGNDVCAKGCVYPSRLTIGKWFAAEYDASAPQGERLKNVEPVLGSKQ